jgi:hypothetical protein
MSDYERVSLKQGDPKIVSKRVFYRLRELEDKIENAHRVEIHFEPPFETKYAIVKYYARQGKPLKVVKYYIYGEELKTGKQLICYEYLSSTNFLVKENNFNTKAEAENKLEELKEKK